MYEFKVVALALCFSAAILYGMQSWKSGSLRFWRDRQSRREMRRDRAAALKG
jgi:hypothetical protein